MRQLCRARSGRHLSTLRLALSLLAAALTGLPMGTLAQGTASGDEQTVVVTGSRLLVTPNGLAQNVTVIDQKEIQETNPARIEDILRGVTGVYVDEAGKAGGFASLYMRGAENSHLLIMLDGVKLNDPTTTRGSAYDLSTIDINQIDRIEVLRGPASAIYGGEAIAGVINIITRRASNAGLSGSSYAAIGADHHRRLGGDVAFGQASLRGKLSVGRNEDGGSSGDAFLRLSTVSGTLRFAPGGMFDGEVFGHRTERKSEAFPDDSGGPRLAVNRETTLRDGTDQVYGLNVARSDARGFRVQAGVSIFDRTERTDNAAVDGGVRFPVPAFSSNTNFRRTNASLTVARDYGASASIVAGLEHQNENGSLTSVGDFFNLGISQTLTFRLNRKTNALFVEGRFRLAPPLGAQIGVRQDQVEGVSTRTTPHLGLVWDLPNGATTFKANANEGFKPPSFFALGFPIGRNPDLRPESSRNIELTGTHRLNRAGSSLQMSAFRTHFKDLVDFDGTTFTNINRGTIVVKGLEATMKLNLANRCHAQLGATWLNIDVRDGLQPLRNRPEQTTAASAVCDLDARSTLFAGVNHTGTLLDRSNPTGDIQMPGFTTVAMGYAVQRGALRVRVSIDNLFNKGYEQFVGFPAQDRRLRVELRGTL